MDEICVGCRGTKKVLGMGNMFRDCPLCAIDGVIPVVKPDSPVVLSKSAELVPPTDLSPHVRQQRLPRKARSKSIQDRLKTRLSNNGIVLPINSTKNVLV